ncbi:lysophospholipid acyltransferase family protein [candidate division KSB1 bacterium]|nr:lysophospholipid acyltransferase family protein [candidate division KSB1 bacterium]
MKYRKKIKNWFIYIIIAFFVKIIRIIPRRIGIGKMSCLAWIAFYAARKEREKTIRHLTWAFGGEKNGKDIYKMARKVFLHFGTVIVDAVRIPLYIRRRQLDELIAAQGMENMDRALEKGKGVIALTGHFGNWELLGAWMAQNGYPLKVVGRSAYDPRLDKMIVETRNSAGYTNIARGKATREILRSLRKGGIIGMLIDQDTSVEGVFVNFFNKPAHTASGPVELAEKLGIPVVPIFMHLTDRKRYQVVCGKEVIFDFNQGLIPNVQRCSDVYEETIRRHPIQWVWMHERWKKTPTES